MKFATIRVGGSTSAAVIDDGRVYSTGFLTVKELLEAGSDPGQRTGGSTLENIEFAPVIPQPSKILCIGTNYVNHAREMGVDLPTYPALFAKFAQSLTGANDEIQLGPASNQVDWEAELTVVIGKRLRNATESAALSAIAGFTVANDISVRDWQSRTREALQGKAWEAMTPVGPVMVTRDEIDDARDLRIECFVNDEVVQDARTSDLHFRPEAIAAYISAFITLEPGDLILTGTPAGVGNGRKPPRFLHDGDVVRTRIEGIGELNNVFRRDVRNGN